MTTILLHLRQMFEFPCALLENTFLKLLAISCITYKAYLCTSYALTINLVNFGSVLIFTSKRRCLAASLLFLLFPMDCTISGDCCNIALSASVLAVSFFFKMSDTC